MALSLQEVEVTYADGTRPALTVAEWRVEPGERVGVTGPNGSGKSTLADLLFGLRTQSAGSVRLDEMDMRAIPLDLLRRDVALVRGVELFPGTVLENVRLGREQLSHADITRALADVGLLDELLAMPRGLETELHPHGRPLSHRQACRLMVARAIAGRPRLIVLDGALDQIDPLDEQERLATVLFGPGAPWTVVCITERPDMLARCSRVVMLSDGQVREGREGEA